MAYAPGSGNIASRKTITSHLMLEHDEEGNVMTVIATQSQFGIKLWGAIDHVCSLTGAPLRINAAPTLDDTQSVVARRVPKEDKRARYLRTMVEAKRAR